MSDLDPHPAAEVCAPAAGPGPLAELYPDGFDAGSESESLLNAVYRNGPAMHPDVLGATDNPGADFLKLGVGEALGPAAIPEEWLRKLVEKHLTEAEKAEFRTTLRNWGIFALALVLVMIIVAIIL